MKCSYNSISIGFLVFIFLFSCNLDNKQEKIKKALFSQWKGKTLIIPDDLYCFNKKYEQKERMFDTLSFIHYFNGECTGCIGHLKKMKTFIDKLKTNNVKLYLIAYSNTPSRTKKIISDAKIEYTIYIDSLNSLYFKNRFNSVLLESFLLDKNNRILLLGEIRDKKFEKEIIKIIMR